MELKKPLEYDEQVDRLIAHGMIIDDKEEAIEILKMINYYRFSGYALQYRINPQDSTYKEGTTFRSIYNIYLVDECIRDILRRYVEIVEVYYKTQIAHGFAMKKCIESPHDQHYDENNYYNKEGYKQVIESFKREKNYYKDSLIIKHHKNKYASKMPLWVMVELMSFSNVSKLYSSMYVSDKEEIANVVGIEYSTLENHLHCLSVLRNKCAHAARLYNTEFYPPARFTKNFLRKHTDVKNNSLFAYILILIKRLPDLSSKKQLLKDIETVLEKYEDDIDKTLLGFPSDYKTIMKNNI